MGLSRNRNVKIGALRAVQPAILPATSIDELRHFIRAGDETSPNFRGLLLGGITFG